MGDNERFSITLEQNFLARFSFLLGRWGLYMSYKASVIIWFSPHKAFGQAVSTLKVEALYVVYTIVFYWHFCMWNVHGLWCSQCFLFGDHIEGEIIENPFFKVFHATLCLQYDI